MVQCWQQVSRALWHPPHPKRCLTVTVQLQHGTGLLPLHSLPFEITRSHLSSTRLCGGPCKLQGSSPDGNTPKQSDEFCWLNAVAPLEEQSAGSVLCPPGQHPHDPSTSAAQGCSQPAPQGCLWLTRRRMRGLGLAPGRAWVRCAGLGQEELAWLLDTPQPLPHSLGLPQAGPAWRK